jgi:hypothetical protein
MEGSFECAAAWVAARPLFNLEVQPAQGRSFGPALERGKPGYGNVFAIPFSSARTQEQKAVAQLLSCQAPPKLVGKASAYLRVASDAQRPAFVL